MDTIQTGVFLAALRKSKDMIIEVIKKEKQFDKNSFRKIVLIVAFIFVISSLIIGYILVSDYYRIYSVSDEREQLEESIKQYANISYIIADANDKSQNSDIVKQVSFIGNNKFVLFKRHDELAYVELTRGFNNKYKFDYMESGITPFLFSVKEINNSKYIIMFGKNYDLRINYVEVNLDRQKYKMNIPKQEYFIVYYPLSKGKQNIMLREEDFRVFDINKIDITKDMRNKALHFN